MEEKQIDLGLQYLELQFGTDRVRKSIDAVKNFQVEIPSWVFGNFGGGRFGEYTPLGFARTILEKLDDAAMVHRLTGATPYIATHLLWDFSENKVEGSYAIAERISAEAETRGIRLGSVSPTYFLRGSHRGSLSAPEEQTRSRYIEQTILASKIAEDFGVGLLTLWLPDGSLYPGQVDLPGAFKRTKESLKAIAERVPKKIRVLIEYKVFEPGTYSTVISDWGSASLLAKAFGPNAGVLVDMGHHHHSVNIEQIVARLVSEGVWSGFHFNTRYAADDDHAVEPNVHMARIFYELVEGSVICQDDPKKNWAYMIDQASSRENRMHAILHSVDSLQLSLAKAMLVDVQALKQAQDSDAIIVANRILNNALMNADVRPIVAAARREKNLPLDPVIAYIESGYQENSERNRT